MKLKVLDFTRLLPGPLATQMLLQQGAEVLKITRKGSVDYLKNYPPFVKDVSTLYYMLNDGKTELSIDFESEKGREELEVLIREADLLIEQFRPGVMQHWNLHYEAVKAINPGIIYLSLTGYGQTGPYAKEAGHDLNYLALSAVLDLNRDENGKPVIPGIQIADIAGGAYRVQSACLAALVERYQTGKGKYIDLSMTDGLLPLLTYPLSQYFGGWDPRELNILSGGLVNYNVYKTADDEWMALGALELKFWNAFCLAVERKDWQRENIQELSVHVFPESEVEAVFASKTREAWTAFAQGKDLCLTPVLKLEELEQEEQHQIRAAFCKQGLVPKINCRR